MICSNCGKENLEGSKFCEGCGTLLQAVQQPAEQPVQNIEQQVPSQGYAQPNPYAQPQPLNNQPYAQQPANNQQYAQQPANNQPYAQQPLNNQPYAQPQNPPYTYQQQQFKKAPSIDVGAVFKSLTDDVKAVSKKTLCKAISMLLVFVTVAAMMMGWAKVSMGDEAEDQIPIDVDVSTTFNVFQFKHINGIIKDAISEALDEVDDDDDLPKEVKEIKLKTTVTAIILFVDMIVIALALLAMAAYIFLSVTNSKNALLVGWLSSILCVGAVLLYIVSFLVFSSILSMKIMVFKIEDYVALRMTMGMFITLAAAVGNFVLMFLKKDELKA